MNGVIESYAIRMKQTSKGIWYCDGVDVWREDLIDACTEMDMLMEHVEKILEKHNKPKVEKTEESE